MKRRVTEAQTKARIKAYKKKMFSAPGPIGLRNEKRMELKLLKIRPGKVSKHCQHRKVNSRLNREFKNNYLDASPVERYFTMQKKNSR